MSEEDLTPACTGLGHLWSQGEAAWSRARSGDAAYTALQPLYALCSVCPFRQACEDWAAADHYSGVAAGMVWRNGHPLGHVVVRRRLSEAS